MKKMDKELKSFSDHLDEQYEKEVQRPEKNMKKDLRRLN